MKDRRDFLKLLGLGAAIPIVGVKPAKVDAEPVVPETKVVPSSEYFRKPTGKHPLVFISDNGRLDLSMPEATLNMTYERTPFEISRGFLTGYEPGPEIVECNLQGYVDWFRGEWEVLNAPFTFEFTEEKTGLVHSFPGCYYTSRSFDSYSCVFELNFRCEA